MCDAWTLESRELSAKAVDVLIFIPLIPAIPAAATWWLPWERWIPRKVPNKIIGPYLLYCTFAVWHFRAPWWLVGAVALWGIGVCVIAVFDVRKARRLTEARHWPTAEASVLGIGQTRDDDGFHVTLTYRYKVSDERYGGSESFAFIRNEDAARFEEAYKERTVTVHYRPDKPEVSVLAHEDIVVGEKSP